jgi:hypothetical protein
MKKLFLVLLLTASVSSFAQSVAKEDVEIIQSVYGKSKADLVKNYMGLSGTQATDFIAVYDQYEAERKTLGEKKIQIINDYANNYASLTDEKADELAQANLKNNLDFDKLHSKYYSKCKKVIGAKNAAKFMQLEIYLQTTILSEIQNSIPFIGEMDAIKTN